MRLVELVLQRHLPARVLHVGKSMEKAVGEHAVAKVEGLTTTANHFE